MAQIVHPSKTRWRPRRRDMKEITMKKTALIAMLLLGAVTLPGASFAQAAFPARPIKLVVDSPPGGSTDLLGRIAADGLSQKLGVSVVVENKAGATGGVAS